MSISLISLKSTLRYLENSQEEFISWHQKINLINIIKPFMKLHLQWQQNYTHFILNYNYEDPTLRTPSKSNYFPKDPSSRSIMLIRVLTCTFSRNIIQSKATAQLVKFLNLKRKSTLQETFIFVSIMQNKKVLSRIQGYCYHLLKFHIYVLVYCIGVYLSGLLHSVQRDTDVQNRLLDSVGEGEGGMF